MKETRWAIVGTGYIANEFAKGMQEAAAAELVAVVSRSEENGKTFAQRYGCLLYTSYGGNCLLSFCDREGDSGSGSYEDYGV